MYTTLFGYFSYFCTFIRSHSFNTFVYRHPPRSFSISFPKSLSESSLLSSFWKLTMGKIYWQNPDLWAWKSLWQTFTLRRVQRFLQLGSPKPLDGCKKFNSKTYLLKKVFIVFWAVSSSLDFKVSKKCKNDKHFLLQNCNKVSKNEEFDADFETVEKVAKKLMRKTVKEKVTEKLSFWLLLLCMLIY
jgi:hypothetical protein